MPVESVRGQPLHTKRMASQVKDAAWLEWIAGLMGVGSRQRHSATLPPGQFHCLLDELPLHLIPQRWIESTHLQEPSHQPLFLNPECSVLRGRSGAGRTGTASGFAEGFLPAGNNSLGARPRHYFLAAVLVGSAVGSGGCESSSGNTGSWQRSQRRSLTVGRCWHSYDGRPRWAAVLRNGLKS